MKRSFWSLVIVVVVVFQSCFNTEEFIDITGEGTGTYSLKMDMGQLISFTKMLRAGMDSSGEQKPPEKRDSVVYLRDLMKADAPLSQHERILYKDATVRFEVDEEKDLMQITAFSPFNSFKDLKEIKDSIYVVINRLKVFEDTKNPPLSEGDEASNDENEKNKVNSPNAFMPDGMSEFKADKDGLSYIIPNPEKIKAFMAGDSTMEQLKQISVMMGDMNVKTTIRSYKPLKSVKGNNTEWSADKKTATFTSTYNSFMEDPKVQEYDVRF